MQTVAKRCKEKQTVENKLRVRIPFSAFDKCNPSSRNHRKIIGNHQGIIEKSSAGHRISVILDGCWMDAGHRISVMLTCFWWHFGN